MTDYTVGDLVRFKSSATVCLLEQPGHKDTWRVLWIRGSEECPKGLTGYVGNTLLEMGEKIDWDEMDHAIDALHELWHSAGRLADDIETRVGDA